jgi:hypothetical protein
MTVGVVRVGWLARRAHADETDDVAGRVRERLEAVGYDADGPRRVTEDQLHAGDREVEDQDARQNVRDRLVARGEGQAGAP